MEKFCKQCGHEAKISDKMCTNCGTKLVEQQPQQTTLQTQFNTNVKPHRANKQMPKQLKIIFSFALAFAVLLSGFTVWANLYFSKDSIEDRFFTALENKNSEQLENLLVHENGQFPSKGEIEAFLKLAQDLKEDELKEFIAIRPAGKFIGIFQMYKVSAIEQFAYYDGLSDGIEMKFNQSEIQSKKQSDGITYGPLLPGIYTVNVSLDNHFGKSKTDIKLKLANPLSDKILMDELPIGEASAFIMNYDKYLMSDSYLLVNDQKIKIDENGDSEKFGPIFLDGSQEVKVVVNFPWGTVESPAYKMDASYKDFSAAFLSEEQLKKTKDLLLTFGEQMQNAKAHLTTDVLTSATEILKEDFLSFEIAPLVQENIFYTGKLNKVEINTDFLSFKDGLLMVPTMFDYSYGFFSYGEEPVSMDDFVLRSYVGLAFDNTNNEWKVSYIEASDQVAVEPTVTLEGSGQVYAPNTEAVTAMQENSIRVELQSFMESYTIASVDAINWGDIAYMRPYITADGPRYKEAKDYIAYLVNAGITEEFVSVEVVDFIGSGDGSYHVTTVEEFIIYYPNGQAHKTFETVTEVRNINGTLKVNKLISTKEIK